jgi:expansin (peptidoglycan-binding protein)
MKTLCGALLVLTSLAACSDDAQPAAGSDASTGGTDAVVAVDGTAPQDGSAPPDATATPPDAAILPADDGGTVTYGQTYTGGEFHLGPVDYDETVWHNACAPGTKYATSVRQVEGTLLAGLWSGIQGVAGYCDACIYVTTAKGKSATLRVVTYGATTPNSIDVSPDAYAILNSGEYPRSMTWQLARCPNTGKVMYEFQTLSSESWTSLWVRNARVPLKSVEVKSVNHASYVALVRGTDGTLTDGAGFGKGTFSIRLTGVDNQQIVDTFTWPSAGVAGAMLTGQGNLQ